MRTTARRGLALAGAAALVLSACSGASEESGAPAASAATPCPADGALKIGNVLPQTGNLSFLGPPQSAGSALAVQQINAAEGVLDQQVEAFAGDSADVSSSTATTTTDQMLQRGADVIVVSASSGVTKSVIEKASAAGALSISPTETSTDFTTWPGQGLAFRTAPPDQFQGSVLAEVAAGDGVARPVVLARKDSYGDSLARTFTDTFEGAGGTLAADTIGYDPEAAAFGDEVGQAKAASPDGVVLIGFSESKQIIQEMIKQGIGPDQVKLFLVDGNLSQVQYSDLPAGILAGTKGTLPGVEAADTFRQQLLGIDPTLTEFFYSAEAYDAVNLVALAAVAADSDCGTDIASRMVEVSTGGTQCSTFAECKELLGKGEDIDYQGQSGPVEFAANGDPTVAFMGVYVFGADNKFTPSQVIGPAQVPPLPQDQ